jgi:hypothetical protein
MYMRIVLFRFAAVALVGLGAAVSTVFYQPAARPAVAAVVPGISPAALPIVTLPVVSVRANAADASKAMRQAPMAIASTTTRSRHEVQASRSSDERGGGYSAPILRLDMPYYSFGKVVSRISKD